MLPGSPRVGGFREIESTDESRPDRKWALLGGRFVCFVRVGFERVDKAGDHLRTLTAWLREHMPTAVEVVHQGRSKTLMEVVRGKLPPNATVKDYVSTAGSALLAPHFADRSSEYPIFSVLVTRQNGDQAAQEALLKSACRKANIVPSSISYIEAHGTGRSR